MAGQIDRRAESPELMMDTGVKLGHKSGVVLVMIKNTECLSLVCGKCREPTAVVKVWMCCGHCKELLLEQVLNMLELIKGFLLGIWSEESIGDMPGRYWMEAYKYPGKSVSTDLCVRPQ